MPNTNAESGKNYERRVIAAINSYSDTFQAFKLPQPTWKDRGDIRFSTYVLQAKTSPTGTKTMLSYLEDAEAQAAEHAADDVAPAAIVRVSPEVTDDLVLLRASDFFALVEERDRLEALVNNSPDIY